MRGFSLAGAALLLAAGIANAQAPAQPVPDAPYSSAPSSTESSSRSYQFLADDLNAAAAPEPAGSGGGQYDNHSSRHGLFSRWAFEAGAGANGPTSQSSPYITWGGNFTVGGGFHFSRGLSVLAEYQFMDDKLPGAVIAEADATGGYAHIWSLTIDPVLDLMPKKTNSVYVTGGGGFYRKVTSFTDPSEVEYCTYFYCGIGTENVVVGHFSSNQGGLNVGAGFTHKLGGVYGDGQTKLFAEVRYLWINTPAVIGQSANGLNPTSIAAHTELIPITLGVRF